MKKYILPAIIMIISIFFLNVVIDQPKEEKASSKEKETEKKASTEPTIRLSSSSDSKPMVLLKEGTTDPSGISAKKIKKAIKKAEAVDTNPFDHLLPSFPDAPNSVIFYEWQAQSELISPPIGAESLQSPRYPGEKVFILSAEWPDGKKGIYLSKVNVLRTSSYQQLLAPEMDRLTVLGFFEPDYDYEIPASPYETYVKREVKGTPGELKTAYPDLPLEMLPAFFVFKNDMIMFLTNDFTELQTFLTKETTSVYEGESENWQVQFTIKDSVGHTMADAMIKHKGKSTPPKGEFEIDVMFKDTWTWGAGGLMLNDQKEALTSIGTSEQLTELKDFEVIVRWDGKEEKVKVQKSE
ncbi:hypothetical protein [Bacillus sp. EB01]|uniref:hypothetical protein n=1 Tax=Bacillus sp. EB01 TaxID=1347086 RepID=UPI0005C63D21|nr:hypothetical protein [Bacillus sp. EB01]